MENKIAKNLLLNKTCDNCHHYSDNAYDGAICILYNILFPEERTCKDWQTRNWNNDENENIIAKNILIDKTCQMCATQKFSENGKIYCNQWFGEAIGWQWYPQSQNGTCENWRKEA